MFTERNELNSRLIYREYSKVKNMASRNITDFFKPKPKPSEALASAIEDDIISITTVEREEVRKQLRQVEETKTRRSSYCKYAKTDRAEIGCYAVNHGVASAVRKFKGKFPAIKQQSVSNFKLKHLELQRKGPSASVTEIESKNRGRPNLLPDDLMAKTIDIIKALRLKAAPVSYSVMAAVARGIVMSDHRNLLVENGGHLSFSDDWARRIIYRLLKD